MHKESKTEKHIVTDENAGFTSKELADRISRMENRTGVDLEKLPIVSGNKSRFFRNIKDLYVPKTVRQIPRKTLNTAATAGLVLPATMLMSIPYLTSVLESSGTKGDHYTPGTDVVRIRGDNKQHGTLAHEIGHWVDYNYAGKAGLNTKSDWFKSLPYTLQKELKATAFAHKASSPSEWKKNKEQLTKALTSYLISSERHPGHHSEKYLSKHPERKLKDLDKGMKKRDYKKLLKNLLAQAYREDITKDPYMYTDPDKGTIRMRAPGHRRLAEKLIDKIQKDTFIEGYMYKEGEGDEFDPFKFNTMQKSLADILKRYYKDREGVISYVKRAQKAWENLEPEYRPPTKPTVKAYTTPVDIKYPQTDKGKKYLKNTLGAAGMVHYRKDKDPEVIVYSPDFSNTIEHELTHNVHMKKDLGVFRERWKKYLDFQKKKNELKKELYKEQNSKHIKQINKVFNRLGETFDTDISWWDKLLSWQDNKKYLTNRNEVFQRAAAIKRRYELTHPGAYVTDNDKARKAVEWFIDSHKKSDPNFVEDTKKVLKYLKDPDIFYKIMPAV